MATSEEVRRALAKAHPGLARRWVAMRGGRRWAAHPDTRLLDEVLAALDPSLGAVVAGSEPDVVDGSGEESTTDSHHHQKARQAKLAEKVEYSDTQQQAARDNAMRLKCESARAQVEVLKGTLAAEAELRAELGQRLADCEQTLQDVRESAGHRAAAAKRSVEIKLAAKQVLLEAQGKRADTAVPVVGVSWAASSRVAASAACSRCCNC